MISFFSNPSFNAVSFVDQNKVQFNNLLTVSFTTGGAATIVTINQIYGTRASYTGALSLRGHTTLGAFASNRVIQSYGFPGNISSNTTNYSSITTTPAVWLPGADSTTNTNLASDHLPVFTSPTISPYMSALPNDFGIAPYYASNTMVAQDTLVVSSGTEEWEILVAGTNAANVDAAKVLFCARTV